MTTETGIHLNFNVTFANQEHAETNDASFFLKYRNVHYNDSGSLFVGSMGEGNSAAMPCSVQIDSSNRITVLTSQAPGIPQQRADKWADTLDVLPEEPEPSGYVRLHCQGVISPHLFSVRKSPVSKDKLGTSFKIRSKNYYRKSR